MRGLERVGQQALPEPGVDPGARDEPGAVRGRPRDEPVDALPHLLAIDDALLDEELLERPDPRGSRRLAVADDRIVRVVIVVVAHSAGSSQCSKTST